MGVDNNATVNGSFCMRVLILRLLGFCVASVLCPHASQAQAVYKWTDADGKVHYSEKKDGSKAQEVKISYPPPVQPAFTVNAPNPWAAVLEQSKAKQDFLAQHPNTPQPTQSLSGGRENGTDASRCNLARDVLSGAVRHTNGAKTDQHDRDIATADVKRFCR